MQVSTAKLGTYSNYIYTVIFAKYNNKWLFCRHRERDVFETAGGRIEPGETPLEAAKREFYEETGATKFDMQPAFDYAAGSYGQVFFAEVYELGNMPDFEMAEVGLFDVLPDKLRFPAITPVLYEHLQGWLHAQAIQEELWDVYDGNRQLTGRTHRRGDPMPPGDYNLVVIVCLLNSKGQFLITKRAPTKNYGNMWENPGGCATAGDDSLTAAIREAKEETGLDVNPATGKQILTMQLTSAFFDIWLFKQDFDINDVVLQPGETVDAKYATPDEIRQMLKDGEFYPDNFLEELFEKAREAQPT